MFFFVWVFSVLSMFLKLSTLPSPVLEEEEGGGGGGATGFLA